MDDHSRQRYSHGSLLVDFGVAMPVLPCVGGEAARHELASPGIAGNFLFGQRRGSAVVGAVHDVPEFVQECEGKGERDQVKRGLMLIVSQTVAIGGRLGDLRRLGGFGRSARPL